jgi:hypothetical protein
MDRRILNNILRFFLLGMVQVFLLYYITWELGGVNYLHIQLYPLFIMLLPFRTPPSLAMLLAFLLGFGIDLLYESLGIHAGAAVFTAYCRAGVLRVLKPREGYNITNSPTKAYLGDAWFFRYAALMMALHLFIYFSIEAFTFVYFVQIISKTAVSWTGSMLFLMMLTYVFNPKS